MKSTQPPGDLFFLRSCIVCLAITERRNAPSCRPVPAALWNATSVTAFIHELQQIDKLHLTAACQTTCCAVQAGSTDSIVDGNSVNHAFRIRPNHSGSPFCSIAALAKPSSGNPTTRLMFGEETYLLLPQDTSTAPSNCLHQTGPAKLQTMKHKQSSCENVNTVGHTSGMPF